MSLSDRKHHRDSALRAGLRLTLAGSVLLPGVRLWAQAAPAAVQPPSAEVRLQHLTAAVEQAESNLAKSERDLAALRLELEQLRTQLVAGGGTLAAPKSEATVAEAGTTGAGAPTPEAAEQGDMQSSQIATLDQIKVESASKYPLRISGTLLLSSFANTGRVDEAASPSAALGGSGNFSLSIRQTVLGLDADGPRLFGGVSHADVRVDFFGSAAGQTNVPTGLLRLRTAHAALEWQRTRLFFSLDRPILNPNTPESLVAVAQPELAWSGNLWNWNPQVGLAHTIGTRTRLRLEAALIDPQDPLPAPGTVQVAPSPSLANVAETSRRPGAEARIALLGSAEDHGAQVGVGGYFAPHFVASNAVGAGTGFDSWAATLDYRVPLGRGVVLTGSAYRGQALGGLGAGGYKDYVFRGSGTNLDVRPLEDVGGWFQFHGGVGPQVRWNTGLGIDNAFASQIRQYAGNAAANVYGGIARNRTVFANVIYSPSAYLNLSVEYRNIYTAPAPGRLWTSNTTGVGAAYRF